LTGPGQWDKGPKPEKKWAVAIQVNLVKAWAKMKGASGTGETCPDKKLVAGAEKEGVREGLFKQVMELCFGDCPMGPLLLSKLIVF
jgi:hypothetical protein